MDSTATELNLAPARITKASRNLQVGKKIITKVHRNEMNNMFTFNSHHLGFLNGLKNNDQHYQQMKRNVEWNLMASAKRAERKYIIKYRHRIFSKWHTNNSKPVQSRVSHTIACMSYLNGFNNNQVGPPPHRMSF